MDVTVGIPCRADEPGLQDTLDGLLAACRHPDLPPALTMELVVCINGIRNEADCRPLTAMRICCRRWDISLREIWLSSPSPLMAPGGPRPQEGRRQVGEGQGEGVLRFERDPTPPLSSSLPQGERGPKEKESLSLQSCTVLLTERLGKPRAWNHIWQQARGALVCFCDADVRVGPEAVAALYKKMQQEPHLSLIAAREVPVVEGRGTLWSRIGALGYRFDFGNAGGRLYMMRKEALPQGMPEDLLLEDAWLTVAVGKQRVAKEPRAEVYFLLPATWRDYFAERVRTEGGKLQIRRVHGTLLAQGPIARYRWSQFWRTIPFHEYPLVVVALALRGMARTWAWLALRRRDFYTLYRPFPSTKGWTAIR